MDGFLLVDKEKGFSSFDEIRRARKLSGERKIGHAGTLDPLATGLLILAFNKATKALFELLKVDKQYLVTAVFGAESNSYDADGKIIKNENVKPIEKEKVLKYVREFFTGEISQIPPKYSALKIGGKRACDIMRKGGDVKIEPRKVFVYKFEVTDFDWPEVSFLIDCGSGTYVRSLIHDLGQKLGCGAYVKELRRTKVNGFDVKDAIKLGSVSKIVESDLNK